MTDTTQRASARSHSHARDQVDHDVACVAVTELIEALRTAGYDDPYTTAVLLAGAQSLIRGMPDRKPFVALLRLMASEAASER
jgi:hypothetical protein